MWAFVSWPCVQMGLSSYKLADLSILLGMSCIPGSWLSHGRKPLVYQVAFHWKDKLFQNIVLFSYVCKVANLFCLCLLTPLPLLSSRLCSSSLKTPVSFAPSASCLSVSLHCATPTFSALSFPPACLAPSLSFCLSAQLEWQPEMAACGVSFYSVYVRVLCFQGLRRIWVGSTSSLSHFFHNL